MRSLAIVMLALVGCSKGPQGVKLEETVACGKAVDALEAAQAKSVDLAAEEFKTLTTACLGTLKSPACLPLAKDDAPPEAMKACVVAYCAQLPAPKPELCVRPVSIPAVVALSTVELAIAAKKFDLGDARDTAAYLAPFAAHEAALAYSKQRWGCGRAARVLRVERERVNLFDGASLKELSGADAGDDIATVVGTLTGASCTGLCIATASDVTLGRLKQVVAGLGPCGVEVPVSTFDSSR